MTKNHVTRRDVLKSGCALAAGMTAPYVITSSALGNETIAPASDRVTLGCIGVGGRGRSLLGGFRQVKTAQVVAISDCYQSRRDSLAKVLNATSHADFRELIGRDDVDAVVIATPDHWHVPIAM